MSFDWLEYFELAGELKDRTEISAKRSAISRAYYSAFNVAKLHLEKEGASFPRDGRVHDLVWTEFQCREDECWVELGTNGKELKRLRTFADYDQEFPDLERRLAIAIGWSSDILSKLAT